MGLRTTTATDRLSTTSSSTSPVLRNQLAKKLALRITGLLMVAGVISVATAADQAATSAADGHSTASDSSGVIQLTKNSDTMAGNGAPKSISTVVSSTTGNSSSSSSNSSNRGASIKVTINGQEIPVSNAPNSQQFFTTDDGTAHVSVSNSSSGNDQNYSVNTTITNTTNMSSGVNQNVTMESNYGSP